MYNPRERERESEERKLLRNQISFVPQLIFVVVLTTGQDMDSLSLLCPDEIQSSCVTFSKLSQTIHYQ